ncbi:HXXEE domain-containing protein [Streptococcus mutans]|uniref:HXXEE domain-containing protein n=1 Tax=Streptococcus mutans TaxID=1309 RepID=UPI000463E7F7|nr:HXXEE domain-containing protein [Streptococcus mutans]MCB4971685.1 HXXEE domain-containing protein [Streptococcus mutans]MCB4973516.1 HXXEE domain-containing protein [Streptococcus mutans]MCY7125698.1 HXXEE domain-containing protein [Streptococcus mutans]
MNLLSNYFMLPILFILHDFEEMIFVPLWKNSKKVQSLNKTAKFFGRVNNGPAFSIGVLEEFVILLIISAICQATHNTELYLGFCIAYAYHFLIHFRMCIQYKGYVPGIYTVILQIPIMVIIILHYWKVDISFIFYLIPIMLLSYINLYIMHKIMPSLQHWLLNLFKG